MCAQLTARVGAQYAVVLLVSFFSIAASTAVPLLLVITPFFMCARACAYLCARSISYMGTGARMHGVVVFVAR